MALLKPDEAALAKAIVRLALSNPFLPERIEAEKAILGERHLPVEEVWSAREGLPEESPNVRAIARLADDLVGELAARLRRGRRPGDREVELYGILALYVLYERCQNRFHEHAPHAHRGSPPGSWRPQFEALDRDVAELLEMPDILVPGPRDPAHLFAFFFQVHCAFQHIFHCLVGRSMAGARLRAAVWESVFTHDVLRYLRGLHSRMGDLNTLVTGPSGTGKELVARAVGLSRYVPFDAGSFSFAADPGASFFAVNLSALTPTLIESELFGHRKGAFTGALEHRAGWFAVCGEYGTVFLDEIGEVEPSIQVKLLRVLENRSFVCLGGERPQPFLGKVVAATNRDLSEEMREGRFREDLYYRLCSDVIVTPSLRRQLEEDPGELLHLVTFVVRRVVGEEAVDLVDLVVDRIEKDLGRDYPWPGNFRELEQCVRNVMIRREYRPAVHAPPGAAEDLAAEFREGRLSAEDLVRRYATIVYAKTGTYEETARRLGLDRRTVKKKVDPSLLSRILGSPPTGRTSPPSRRGPP